MLVAINALATLQEVGALLQFQFVRRSLIVRTCVAAHVQRDASRVGLERAAVVEQRIAERHHQSPRHSALPHNALSHAAVGGRHISTLGQFALNGSNVHERQVNLAQLVNYAVRQGSRLRTARHTGQSRKSHCQGQTKGMCDIRH